MTRGLTGLIGWRVGVQQSLAGCAGDSSALAEHALAANHVRAGGPGDLCGGVAGAVVGDPDGRAGKRPRERCERGGDAIGLVVGGYEDDRGDVGGSVGDAIYCGAPVVASDIRRSERIT
jgi:hypothetical protein